MEAQLVRIEKKVDELMRFVKWLLSHQQDGHLAPMPQQLIYERQDCPLCMRPVYYVKQDGVVVRSCGCELPAYTNE